MTTRFPDIHHVVKNQDFQLTFEPITSGLRAVSLTETCVTDTWGDPEGVNVNRVHRHEHVILIAQQLDRSVLECILSVLTKLHKEASA